MATFLELAFNLPLYQSFTYKNLENLEEEDGTDSNSLNSNSLIGKRAAVRFGSRNLIGFIVGESDKLNENNPVPAEKIKPINRIVDKEPIFGQAEIELAKWISHFYVCSFGEALSTILPSGKREKSLEDFQIDDDDTLGKDVILSEEQENAIQKIATASEENKSTLFYLFGLTGSGKTEVFFNAIQKVLEQGKSAIYLVPEIGLTHQVIKEAKKRFGDQAAVLHSGLTGSQRLNQWMRIKRNEAKVIIGARSAIFAPAENIGLVVIDEEHDSSYKSGNSPRYNARQVAMYLTRKHKCPLVMGSATPSIEAWHLIQEKRIELLSLTKRLAGGSLPHIEVENLAGVKGSLTPALIEEMRKTKNMGKQTILFLNRRGFSHLFRCRSCGYEMLCKNCSVPMTYHKADGKMKCHYCGMQSIPPKACPDCHSMDILFAGIGTEYIEEEVRRSFPDCSIARIDTDTVSKNKNLNSILKEFREGKIDILLGTQMIAKGLNFPKVRLVGIVMADTGLQMPDFRAGERSFSLITQAAGRAGRYSDDGLVIIQSLKPEHPAIVCAKNMQHEYFYQYELEQRKLLDFPPYKRLIRLVFRSKDAKKAELASEGAKQILESLLNEHIEKLKERKNTSETLSDTKTFDADIMGPAECMLSLIAGNHRQQIILRSDSLALIQGVCQRFIREYKPITGVYIEVDVDPLNLF